MEESSSTSTSTSNSSTGFGGGMAILGSSGAGVWGVIAAVGAAIIISWAYAKVRPPPPKVCGSEGGPSITATRICLRDGRYLAYKEAGVPKDEAKYKVVSIHPIGGSRNSMFRVSQEFMEELGVYMVAFDRPGYGQSDPFPRRSVKSQALDIEELADKLELGEKFYVVAISMGGFSAWACLKYIPHRLAGVAMMAPAVNYWWPNLHKDLANEAFYALSLADRIELLIARHVPSLLHFWKTQTWLPTSETKQKKMLPKFSFSKRRPPPNGHQEPREFSMQQGLAESMHRDISVHFGKWEFFPGDLPNNNVPVHIWQGTEDRLVPVALQRYIHERLPWITYHEVPGVGHSIDLVPGLKERVLRELLVGEGSTDSQD